MSYFELANYDRLKDDHINKIKDLSLWVWKNDIDNLQIDEWIEKFTAKVDSDLYHEEINSLFLLKQYMYFGQREFREMLKAAYHNHFFKPELHKLKKLKSLNKLQLKSEMDEVLKKTKFLGIGNSSESSSLCLYYFRQVNKLKSNVFWNIHDVFQYTASSVSGLNSNENNQKVENYIFIDDISGSGIQAYSFFTGKDRNGKIVKLEILKEILKINPSANIIYLTLFSTNEANEKLSKLSNLTLKSVFILDDTYKAFNEESRYFSPKDKKNKETDLEKEERLSEITYAKKISEEYFNLFNLEPYYKYGFKNSQLLLSFFYNTPNNTLPIFWARNKQWYGIFKRYDKALGE